MNITATGYVCADCLMVIANADTSGIADVDAWADAVKRTNATENGRYDVVVGDDELTFSRTSCDYCGTTLDGYRHEVVFFDRLPDDVDADAFDAYITGVVGSLDYFDSLADAVAEFRNAYVGAMTLTEYAEQCADEFIGRDGFARDYFDAERYARDLRMSGEYTESDGYVFSHV